MTQPTCVALWQAGMCWKLPVAPAIVATVTLPPGTIADTSLPAQGSIAIELLVQDSNEHGGSPFCDLMTGG